MKSIFQTLLFLFIAVNVNAQSWNYPPEPISNWQENASIPKDSLRQVTVWNHVVVDGVETGKKEMKLIQDFDSAGNTTQVIYRYGDTVLFDKYINGFWQIKISNDQPCHQQVLFDSSGNVTYLSVNKFSVSVTYDEYNRPLQSVSTDEIQNWTYTGDKLTRFTVIKNDLLSEERIYYYDSIANSVAYVTRFYDNTGKQYPYPDSSCAYFNAEQHITKIVSVSHFSDGYQTTTTEIDYVTHVVTTKNSAGCSQVQTDRDAGGRPLTTVVRNCDGTLLRKTSYTYLFE